MAGVLTLMTGVLPDRAVAGVPGSIIINELMYNPGTGNQNDEFLELYNTTGADINLEGWCFSAGITLVTAHSDPACFPAGTLIPANGFLIVSPDSAQTNMTYGITPSAVYTSSNLSNGGETITLVDETAQIINSVTYDDASPWPTSPDGDGPSAELKNPSADNTNGSNWGASVGGPTPMAENSWLNLDPPTISNVTDPNGVTATDTVNIVATVSDADTVNLVYKVMFQADVTIAMQDDGQNGDGLADDGVYGAVIPAQSTGSLVRFRVSATNDSGTETSPSGNDSMDYAGYVVRDESVTSQLPILNWFMDDAEYEDMTTNHVYDDQKFQTVLAYGDDVYDNVDVRIKGEYSRSFPKKSLKFNMPSGYKLAMSGYFDDPVSEFHMNGEWLDESKAMTVTVWQIAEEIGMNPPNTFGTRLQRNNEYHGYFLAVDKYGPEYQQRAGLDGELYESTYEKVSPDDNNPQPAIDFMTQFNNPAMSLQDRRTELYDNADLPNLVNYAAFESLINSHDSAFAKNQFQHFDVFDTQRWSIYPYDRDIVIQHRPTIVNPYVTPTYFKATDRVPLTTLYDQPAHVARYISRQ
jgi:hypothetical protein